VGKAVGYSDSNYFTKVFKRITGQSPTEYRNG
jgi:two-component system response regulator YesN